MSILDVDWVDGAKNARAIIDTFLLDPAKLYSYEDRRELANQLNYAEFSGDDLDRLPGELGYFVRGLWNFRKQKFDLMYATLLEGYNLGYKTCLIWLTHCFHYGLGTKKDFPKLIGLLNEGMKCGFGECWADMSLLYCRGIYVKMNQKKSDEFMDRAIELGYHLGRYKKLKLKEPRCE